MIQQIKNKNELIQILKSNKKVIIDFFATWCGPCKMQTPIMHELSQEQDSIIIASVDTNQASDVAAMFAIEAIPTLIYFSNQKEIKRWVGFTSKEDLLNFIKSN